MTLLTTAIQATNSCSPISKSTTHFSRLQLISVLALILGLAAVLDLVVADAMSPTADEHDFVAYGVQILHLRPPNRSGYLLWNSKTPVSALNALPQVTAAFLDRHGVLHRLAEILQDLRSARLPSIVALLLVDWFVYRWAYELYGGGAALACVVMVVLSPNLIAHGTLATTDGYFVLGVIASLYFFRVYLLRPTLRNACLSAFVVAAAQLMKPFALYLYGVIFCFLILRVIRKSSSGPRLSPRSAIVYLALNAAFLVGVLNVGYALDRPFVPLKSYAFDSGLFKKLQRIPVVQNLRVPFPYAYLEGLDVMKYCDDSRLTYGNTYLLGELHRLQDPGFHNFKSYYLVAIIFKEPIPLQILFVAGILWILRHRHWDDFIFGEAPLLVAAIILIIWQSLFRNSQIGIRNIAPALAVDVIIAGAVFANFSLLRRSKQTLLILLLVWLGVSTMSYYPHMIPYMNEWVSDRKFSYKILADSNIDWGQNQYLVDKFLAANPDVKLNPEVPVSGRVLVSVNRLVGIPHRIPNPPTWLLQYRPVSHIGYAHLLYVIPPR